MDDGERHANSARILAGLKRNPPSDVVVVALICVTNTALSRSNAPHQSIPLHYWCRQGLRAVRISVGQTFLNLWTLGEELHDAVIFDRPSRIFGDIRDGQAFAINGHEVMFTECWSA